MKLVVATNLPKNFCSCCKTAFVSSPPCRFQTFIILCTSIINQTWSRSSAKTAKVQNFFCSSSKHLTTTTQRESTTTSPSLLKLTRSTPNSLCSTFAVPRHSNSPTLKIKPTSTPYLSTRIKEEHRVSDIDSTSTEIKNTLTNPFFQI